MASKLSDEGMEVLLSRNDHCGGRGGEEGFEGLGLGAWCRPDHRCLKVQGSHSARPFQDSPWCSGDLSVSTDPQREAV